jgi:hypothetical protein
MGRGTEVRRVRINLGITKLDDLRGVDIASGNSGLYVLECELRQDMGGPSVQEMELAGFQQDGVGMYEGGSLWKGALEKEWVLYIRDRAETGSGVNWPSRDGGMDGTNEGAIQGISKEIPGVVNKEITTNGGGFGVDGQDRGGHHPNASSRFREDIFGAASGTGEEPRLRRRDVSVQNMDGGRKQEVETDSGVDGQSGVPET